MTYARGLYHVTKARLFYRQILERANQLGKYLAK